MAKKRLTGFPEVFIKEESTLPPSIQQLETALPAFIGYTEKASVRKQPVLVHSMVEYEKEFGTISKHRLEITTVDSTKKPAQLTYAAPLLHHLLYYSLQLFFANGGKKCYVVSAGSDKYKVSKKALLACLPVLKSTTDCTLLCVPDAILLSPEDSCAIYNAMLQHCSTGTYRFAIIDVPVFNTSSADDISFFRKTISSEKEMVKAGAAYYPYLQTTLRYEFADDRVYDQQTNKTLTALKKADTGRYQQIKSALAATTLVLPASAAMAGIYSRVDANRGVWKAPANEVISNVQKPVLAIDNQMQENLNVDPSGLSINAIREFAGKGTLVWGARTLAGNDNEWRYISVRRLFMMVEASVKKAIAVFVFESNDAPTWIKIKAMIENYLVQLWRQGALPGSKTNEAFYVRIGLGQTMTAQDVSSGSLIVEIGMAVIRPNEFIVLRLLQRMQPA